MASVFADVPDWPSPADKTLGMGSNQPPLEDRLLMEFEEELAAQGITARVTELLSSAERCPPAIEDEATAGKVGDLCRLARDVEKRINDARERHNRPLLTAQRALKGKADSVITPLQNAISSVRARLNAYVARKDAEAAAECRRVEDEARKAREAMQEAGVDDRLVETVQALPPPQRTPVARGDLGSTVVATTEWHHKVLSVRKLPNDVLNHSTVLEAIDKVLRARIRNGELSIKGTEIWPEKKASVR